MIGLAHMAKRLAYHRAYGSDPPLDEWEPIERRHLRILHVDAYPAAREYYRILDRLALGVKP